MYSTIQSSISYQVRVKTGGNVCLVKRLSLMNPATTTHRSHTGASCTYGGSADPLRFNNKHTRPARSYQSVLQDTGALARSPERSGPNLILTSSSRLSPEKQVSFIIKTNKQQDEGKKREELNFFSLFFPPLSFFLSLNKNYQAQNVTAAAGKRPRVNLCLCS